MYEYPVRPEEEKKIKILPFQVHFGSRLIPGKSYVRPGLPDGIPHTVTEKFYRKDQYNISPEKIEEMAEKLKTLGPKDKYGWCVTENQRYGWYNDIKFTDLDKNDNRLHFARRIDHFAKLYFLTTRKE